MVVIAAIFLLAGAGVNISKDAKVARARKERRQERVREFCV
jgi:hypothetical protein